MPTTVNGIGTRYVWRSNVQKRTAVCEFCHRGYELTSYDTRLWFVVLYIPVIPLTKKRILDQCPGCSMHRAMPLAEWGRIKRESIQQGMQSLKDEPNDPAAAKKLHGTLMAFDQHEKA